MINKRIAAINKTKNGFDPIDKEYALTYFNETYGKKNRLDYNLISILKEYTNIKYKKIVDLGAGPGQYEIKTCQNF